MGEAGTGWSAVLFAGRRGERREELDCRALTPPRAWPLQLLGSLSCTCAACDGCGLLPFLPRVPGVAWQAPRCGLPTLPTRPSSTSCTGHPAACGGRACAPLVGLTRDPVSGGRRAISPTQ